MAKAIVLREHGGVDRLVMEDIDMPVLRANEALIDVSATGVNFMDIGVRNGMLWKDRPLPLVPGVEGAGAVVAVGADVTDLSPGQRVAWVYGPGSYAGQVALPVASLVPLPDDIGDETAAALMMQGITASHFATSFYETKPGDVALVHAVAGGVGSLVSQIVKLRGGTVIGRVSSEEKIGAARAAGADHVIVDAEGSFSQQVLDLTEGKGVDVVFDGSGASTFKDSMASLGRHGVLAYYGPVLGAPAPINVATLPRSIKIGFPTFADHIPDRDALLKQTSILFEWVRSGKLRIGVGRRYPLSDAALAHADLESRRTTGKLLLLP
ncbi:quinone oxidoreductase family protein [Rhizobium terrae]|uniref:quinone oxidoreductase family protein n=1 Tax=Rhizobium terrae TaxID=2171756 RepID=UPI000E3CCD83|nr:quinone oxidoreductase [Rhizobium terrae]